jgi:hypothetical protein
MAVKKRQEGKGSGKGHTGKKSKGRTEGKGAGSSQGKSRKEKG